MRRQEREPGAQGCQTAGKNSAFIPRAGEGRAERKEHGVTGKRACRVPGRGTEARVTQIRGT